MKQALSVILRNSAPPAGGDPLGNDEGDFVAAIFKSPWFNPWKPEGFRYRKTCLTVVL